ncbi:MAG: hypothetical protein LBN29_03355 [Mediterranea sp.]|jgi:hypothetical protein|nr:hypothetical protein [Mediterranea sp.]
MRSPSGKAFPLPLATCLRASTLIETIVASIIFLCVFAMAMDTMTRLFASGRDDGDHLLVESAMGQRRRALERDGAPVPGSRTYVYPWGELRVDVRPYGESSSVFEVDMRAVTLRKKEVAYRYILGDEDTGRRVDGSLSANRPVDP